VILENYMKGDCDPTYVIRIYDFLFLAETTMAADRLPNDKKKLFCLFFG